MLNGYSRILARQITPRADCLYHLHARRIGTNHQQAVFLKQGAHWPLAVRCKPEQGGAIGFHG